MCNYDLFGLHHGHPQGPGEAIYIIIGGQLALEFYIGGWVMCASKEVSVHRISGKFR